MNVLFLWTITGKPSLDCIVLVKYFSLSLVTVINTAQSVTCHIWGQQLCRPHIWFCATVVIMALNACSSQVLGIPEIVWFIQYHFNKPPPTLFLLNTFYCLQLKTLRLFISILHHIFVKQPVCDRYWRYSRQPLRKRSCSHGPYVKIASLLYFL